MKVAVLSLHANPRRKHTNVPTPREQSQHRKGRNPHRRCASIRQVEAEFLNAVGRNHELTARIRQNSAGTPSKLRGILQKEHKRVCVQQVDHPLPLRIPLELVLQSHHISIVQSISAPKGAEKVGGA